MKKIPRFQENNVCSSKNQEGHRIYPFVDVRAKNPLNPEFAPERSPKWAKWFCYAFCGTLLIFIFAAMFSSSC